MTPEQIADSESVWKRMEQVYPEFTREHDPSKNYHAVREIILGGSVTWAKANSYFGPAPGRKVMDVGANVGIFSTFCGLKGADVVAYEPFPEIFSMFSGMIKRTGLDKRVNVVNAAVWTHTGEMPYIGHRTDNEKEGVTFYNGSLPAGGVGWNPDDSRIITTKCVSFDDAIGDTEWDMVKVDIEGAEFDLFLSASTEALKRIKFAYVELHPWASQELYDAAVNRMKEVFRFEGFFTDESRGRGRYEVVYLFRKDN